MVRSRTDDRIGAGHVLLGAVLLGSALIAPWYFYDGVYVQHWGTPSGPESVEIGPSVLDFYLVALPGAEPVQTSCPSGNISYFCPTSSTYSRAGLNGTERVVALTLGLESAGFAAAAAAGVLGITRRGGARGAFLQRALPFVAIALAISATASFAALLPGALAKDVPTAQHGDESAGPWSSFYGSQSFVIPVACPSPGCAMHNVSWGPSVGWALSIAAIAVLLVGAAMTLRSRRDPI